MSTRRRRHSVMTTAAGERGGPARVVRQCGALVLGVVFCLALVAGVAITWGVRAHQRLGVLSTTQQQLFTSNEALALERNDLLEQRAALREDVVRLLSTIPTERIVVQPCEEQRTPVFEPDFHARSHP